MNDEIETTDKLVGWVLSTIRPWIDFRNQNYEQKWNEYYRLWRGIWAASDKDRNSERSRIIVPALQQAIEVAVAEQEEAIFGKGENWFDISDDYIDTVNNTVDENLLRIKRLLQEDLKHVGIQQKISESFLNGAIYGTGIGKVSVEVEREYLIDGDSQERVVVRLLPVQPDQFFIDPVADDIESAMGCGEEIFVPKHEILKKQEDGIYFHGFLGNPPGDEDLSQKGESGSTLSAEKVKITEYHGLIPRHLLNDSDEYLELEEAELVEAIVTIANDRLLLRAIENPFTMKDRCYVAYQHDTVPARFHGRGVAEKGYNVQKALDAEMRGRIDAMALSIHPMMAVDSTRLAMKGGDLSIRPGKTILTNGSPGDALMPFNFGQVNPNTFSQSGELERMIQMATGSMDSAAPIGVSPRNSTASGMSMMQSGSIKRSKRTLANIANNFINPLINKITLRYIQFDPERYPAKDVKFNVISALGIMAREIEQQQLSGLLNTVPPDSPAYWMLIRSIYENSSITNKDEMMRLVDGLLQRTLNPQPDPMQQQLQQLTMMKEQKEIEKLDSEIAKNIATAKSMLNQTGEGDSMKEILNARIRQMEITTNKETELTKAQINANTKLQVEAMKIESQKVNEKEDKEEKNIVVNLPSSNKTVKINRENGKVSGATITSE